MWFIEVMTGKNLFKFSNAFLILLNALFKFSFPVLATIMAIFFPYSIVPSHVNLLKSLAQYASHAVVAIMIIMIFFLSFGFNQVLGFIYLNSLIALSVDFFRRATRGNKLKKTRIKGYIFFVTILCGLVLSAISILIFYLKSTQSGVSVIAQGKRDFFAAIYQVDFFFFSV